MKLGIVGSRLFDKKERLYEVVDKWINEHGKPRLIVSGGAKGADKLAEEYAIDRDIPIRIYPAEWETYGRGAGPIRNQLIVDDIDFLIAFPDSNSRGTLDSINKAVKKDIPIWVRG